MFAILISYVPKDWRGKIVLNVDLSNLLLMLNDSYKLWVLYKIREAVQIGTRNSGKIKSDNQKSYYL